MMKIVKKSYFLLIIVLWLIRFLPGAGLAGQKYSNRLKNNACARHLSLVNVNQWPKPQPASFAIVKADMKISDLMMIQHSPVNNKFSMSRNIDFFASCGDGNNGTGSYQESGTTTKVKADYFRHEMPDGYTIPTIDLDQEQRQVLVDRRPDQYLGHPSTVLLSDDKTILIVYPTGHGRGAIQYKKSPDGGLTWSELLPAPKSWATSLEVPTLFRMTAGGGPERIILFSGLYPARRAYSEDNGTTWTELEPVGNWGGIVVLGSAIRLKDGRYLAMFHDDGRFFTAHGVQTHFKVYKTYTKDGGLTWSFPEVMIDCDWADPCEPGIIRSPDGQQLLVLMRENSRKYNSFFITSDDEGETWSPMRELPAALTGDRHTGKYAPDGRLFISFRDQTQVSPTKGDWVGWVGTFDDIINGREGQYRVRLKDNTHKADCAYPGVELLPGGTFVVTTYGHWREGEPPYIVSTRFTLQEIDALAQKKAFIRF